MSTATDMLALYITAEKTVLAGQSYTINGHSYTRADLSKVQEGQRFWQTKVNKENSLVTGNKTYALADFT